MIPRRWYANRITVGPLHRAKRGRAGELRKSFGRLLPELERQCPGWHLSCQRRGLTRPERREVVAALPLRPGLQGQQLAHRQREIRRSIRDRANLEREPIDQDAGG